AAGARTRSELVAGGDHAMLRRGGHWHRAAAEGVAALLAGR
ncbi:hypothetical protein GA0115242_10767, partial [Streptomyces sp. SolWspMP-5a-2]